MAFSANLHETLAARKTAVDRKSHSASGAIPATDSLGIIFEMKGCWKLAVSALMPLLATASGCNSITFNAPLVPTPQAQYRAYGDSITQGYTLSDPVREAYPTLVALHELVTFANNARDGDESCDVTAAQMFPNQDSPTLVSHPFYTVLIGTNDADRTTPIPYEPIFALCHQAAISWAAVPLEYKVLANSGQVTTNGPGALESANNWNAWKTGGQGASISFRITTAREGPIYAWPRIDDNSAGNYTYSLDGVVLGSGSMQTTPKLATKNGTTSSLGFLRLARVPAGEHVITFTQTNAGADGFSIVGIASPLKGAADKLPTVLAGVIPLQNHDSQPGRCTPTEPICLAYVQIVTDDAAMFASDGLDVRVFDTRKYMQATSAEMSDQVHPNALGHQELSRSVEAAW